MFKCQAICGKEKKKEKIMPFRQKFVVAATFLDFQANKFSLLFEPNNRKFFYRGVLNKAVLMMYFLL
jgi:hypothetical protein